MAKAAEVKAQATPTPEERIAKMEVDLKKMQVEWEAYKKVSPFYKQTQQVIMHKQKPQR